MSELHELKWGETIWDDMPLNELLREVQRKHAALMRAYSILSMMDRGDYDPFWGKNGSGGAAIEMVRQALGTIDQSDREHENAYRAFWRYAVDLLFDRKDYDQIGSGWVVCPECGTMLGDKAGTLVGQACTWTKACKGVFRRIEWSDLDPSHETDKGDAP